MWTRKGWFYLGLAVVSGLLGLATRSVFLLSLCAFLLTALTVLVFFTRLHKVVSSRDISSEKIFEDGEVEIKLNLVNKGGRTGFLELRDKLPKQVDITKGTNYLIVDLKANESLAMAYRVKAPVRGIFEVGPVTLRAQDPFTIFYKELKLDVVDHLTVFPIVYDIKDVPIKSRAPKLYPGASKVKQPGPGSEFFLIRDYSPGDPFKSINWKAYAKTGKLLVNEKEREAVSDIMIIVDARASQATGTDGKNPLLYSTRAAATLAQYFLKRRDSVGLVIFGEKLLMIKQGQGQKQLFEILTALANAEARGTLPLQGVVDVGAPYFPKRSPVILLTSMDEDPSLIRAVSQMRTLEFDVSVISPNSIDFELMARSRMEPGIEHTMPYEVLRLERDVMVQDLRGYGARVIDWDPKVPLVAALLAAAQQLAKR
ncbi:MAG TPA: DUF58 domain-containing protein [Candidatus Thermoplasmatota archaeon]|nr:DUF58 domain-containing protein [Candidatus Thermoplasmatota archaeon]